MSQNSSRRPGEYPPSISGSKFGDNNNLQIGDRSIVNNNYYSEMDTYEPSLAGLDAGDLDHYYQKASGPICTPTMKTPEDIEDDVSWVTAASTYESWITDPKANTSGHARVMWCQTGDETDKATLFSSFFQLKDECALAISCRDIPFEPSKLDPGLVDHEAPSSNLEQPLGSNKIRRIVWGFLVRLFAVASPVIEKESFGLHILSSMPPRNKRSMEELANLTALLCNSLATWTAKLIIILDHLDCLNDHELLQLDRAFSQLLQQSNQVRIMLFSKITKPGPLRDNAIFVDQDTVYRECSSTFYVKNLTRRRDHIAQAFISTNHWIWSNPSYRSLATNPSVNALWITGKPGSGKSVLSRTIEDELTRKGDSKTAVVATWFYSVRDNLMEHSEMLSGMLYQILLSEKRVFRLISKRYCNMRKNASKTQWSFAEMKDMFSDIVRDQSLDVPFFFVLDGIDESSLKGASGECSRAKMLQFFLDTLQCSPTGMAKMIFLSRPEDDIRSALRKLPSIRMHQENSKDIELVVDRGIQSIMDELGLLEDSDSDDDHDEAMTMATRGLHISLFEQGKQAQGELIQHIRGYLIEKADGVILWVSSVISHILMKLGSAFCTLRQLSEEIEKLPSKLSEVYVTIVHNIAKCPNDSSTLALAQTALLWVRSNPALGKFYAQDLLEVLAIDQDQHRWATVTGWSSFQKQLTRLCGPFVEIVTKDNGWKCDPYDPVQLLHHTVKTFLDDPQASTLLHLSVEESEKRYQLDCVRYIQKALPEIPSPSDPLRDGAIANLDGMIHNITTHLESKPLLSFVLTFNPKMASFIPVRYKEILKTLIMLPPSAGGLGVDSIRQLFYESCKNGRVNAICALFAICSQWLNTWEWYLIEPEIIKGTLLAAKEFSMEREMDRLQSYAWCRGILSGLFPAHSRNASHMRGYQNRTGGKWPPLCLSRSLGGSGTQFWSSKAEADQSDLCDDNCHLYIDTNSVKSSECVSRRRDVVRAIDEVLAFWTQLAGSPELQTSEAFTGAEKPHLSESPAIAWRMATIRISVLDSTARSVRARFGGWGPGWGLWEPGLQVQGGLRIVTSHPDAVTGYPPFVDSPFSEGLSKIEQAPTGNESTSLASLIWLENLRSAMKRDEGISSKYCCYFKKLPPILPSIMKELTVHLEFNTVEASS
ncbi:hypothetical protein EDB80DRAFT_713560 [Ilyonectria destructans]|nr:hypothetical protein EDB80DRAFT_713560 [Ilyonectria destructans]